MVFARSRKSCRLASGLTLAVSLFVLVGWRLSLAQAPEAADHIPLATSINALMVALVDHSAHEIWEAGSAATMTAQDWQEAEQHAIQLVASGTLISLGGTGIADAGWVTAPAWQQWSQRMTERASAALAAVRNTDQNALNDAGGRLIEACEGCHQAFKPDLPTEGLTHVPHYGFRTRQTVTLKSAVVALAAEPELRAEFEDGLVARALELDYNAVPSYDLVPDVTDVNDPGFIRRMVSNGVGAVLMVKPAAVGPGATLESVRNAVSPTTYASMQAFARELSPSGEDEVLAVVHLGLYLLSVHGAELVSSGAVWLDEPNPSRAEGIARLQNLIVTNVNNVRPAIREHLGLPPLERR
jgi:hypothetical protein